MDKQASTYKNESDRKRDMRRMKIATLKSSAYMKIHSAWWQSLFFLGLGWKYSKMLCAFGIYKKFPDGRCGYCGNIHGFKKHSGMV
jgi:hypothetical protein